VRVLVTTETKVDISNELTLMFLVYCGVFRQALFPRQRLASQGAMDRVVQRKNWARNTRPGM